MTDSQQIILITANVTATTPEAICSRRKAPNVVQAREIAAYAIRGNTKRTLEQIGKAIGDRNHTSAMKIIDAARDKLASNQAMRDILKVVIERFQNQQTP